MRVESYVENFTVVVNQVAFGSRLAFLACLHLSFDFVHAIDGNRVGVVVVASDREVVEGVAVVFREVSEVDGIGHVAGVLGVLVLSLHDDIGSVVRCIFERTVCRAYLSFALRVCPGNRYGFRFLDVFRHVELQFVVNDSEGHTILV